MRYRSAACALKLALMLPIPLLMPEIPKVSARADKVATGRFEAFPAPILICLDEGSTAARDASDATLGAAAEASLGVPLGWVVVVLA